MTNDLDKADFVAPTMVNEYSDNMKIVEEEVFGPVRAVSAFDSEQNVFRRVNNTKFGLSAGVFASDIQHANSVINLLQTAICWINNYNIIPIEMPYGDYKQSGIGRKNSQLTIHHCTQLKSGYVEMGGVETPY